MTTKTTETTETFARQPDGTFGVDTTSRRQLVLSFLDEGWQAPGIIRACANQHLAGIAERQYTPLTAQDVYGALSGLVRDGVAERRLVDNHGRRKRKQYRLVPHPKAVRR